MIPHDNNGRWEKIGRHDADIANLKGDVAEIKGDVKSILELVNKQRGAWKALALLGTVGGAISGLAVSILGIGK